MKIENQINIIHVSELLSKETRILFDEAIRRELFADKAAIMQKLNLHRNTVNSWIRGEYKPSIEQLETLGVSIKDKWNHIISLNVEGSTKQFLIREQMLIDKLSWLLGILDGDGFNDSHRIGIINQDSALVKVFMDTCIDAFSIEKKEFCVSVQWYNSNHNISEELGIGQIKTYDVSQYKSNKPVIKAVITNKIISALMENFRHFMESQIDANAKLFRLYVRGLMDSDGSFARKNIYLTQKLNQKNMAKMLIVKKILDNSEIHNFGIKGPNNKDMIYIYLSSDKKTLQLYSRNIGFYSQPKENKLEKLLSDLP